MEQVAEVQELLRRAAAISDRPTAPLWCRLAQAVPLLHFPQLPLALLAPVVQVLQQAAAIGWQAGHDGWEHEDLDPEQNEALRRALYAWAEEFQERWDASGREVK